MLSQGQELAALDFASIIGGPLQAVIKAQAAAAMVTYNFIQAAAFEPSSTPGAGGNASTKLKVVEFDFGQLLTSAGPGGGNQSAGSAIKVPLLTMLPIPFIRVDNMSIDLNVQLHDVQTASLSNTLIASVGTSSSENLEIESSTMTTSVTEQNTFQAGQLTDDTYSLKVSVHAVQDQMPSGMSNILGIFSNVVQTQSVLIQQMMTRDVNAALKTLPPPVNPTPPSPPPPGG